MRIIKKLNRNSIEIQSVKKKINILQAFAERCGEYLDNHPIKLMIYAAIIGGLLGFIPDLIKDFIEVME